MVARGLVPALFVALLGCGGSSVASECEGLTLEECTRLDGGIPGGGEPDGGEPDSGVPPDSSFVVDTDWLNDPNVQLIDTRGSGYGTSRIPGAIHLRPGELAATVDGVPSQVAPPMQAEPVFRKGRSSAPCPRASGRLRDMRPFCCAPPGAGLPGIPFMAK